MKDIVKNGMLMGNSSLSLKQYAPTEYSERQKQYFNYQTRRFTEQRAKYSSDYVVAQIQGLNPAQPFEYTTVHVRFSDVVRSSASISYEFDNYKMIDIAEKEYTYIRKGAKVIAMGNIWLCINPDNMSNVLGKAIIQRCDAVWHYLDYYGNVCAEPMCFDRRLMKANDSDAQRSTMITKGYFDAKVQYNEATAQLFTNSRIMLGTSVYRVTGYSDFIQEFTENINSVNLLEFDVRYEEFNDATDDLERRVAGGKTFSWRISIQGESDLKIGDEMQLKAISTRTAEERTQIVTSTDEHPIYYIWESSDEDVATVDYFGNVVALSEGETTITATLEQNPDITESFTITVTEVDQTPHLAFDQTVTPMLKIYHSVTIGAIYYEGGDVTQETVEWSFSGADEESYTTDINGNKVTIKCWSGSVTPLTVTAAHNGLEVSADISLEGI